MWILRLELGFSEQQWESSFTSSKSGDVNHIQKPFLQSEIQPTNMWVITCYNHQLLGKQQKTGSPTCNSATRGTVQSLVKSSIILKNASHLPSGNLLGCYSDLLGFYSDLLGCYSYSMGYYWLFNGILLVIYPLVMTNSLLLKMVMFIVDLPSYKMVIFHIVFCMFTRPGMFSISFPRNPRRVH